MQRQKKLQTPPLASSIPHRVSNSSESGLKRLRRRSFGLTLKCRPTSKETGLKLSYSLLISRTSATLRRSSLSRLKTKSTTLDVTLCGSSLPGQRQLASAAPSPIQRMPRSSRTPVSTIVSTTWCSSTLGLAVETTPSRSIPGIIPKPEPTSSECGAPLESVVISRAL